MFTSKDRDRAKPDAETGSASPRRQSEAVKANQNWQSLAMRSDQANERQSNEPIVKVPLNDFVHPVAQAIHQPGTRFRVPTFDRLKAVYTDKTLKIPESVIKARVSTLLSRMKLEGRLKTTDDVPTIISKIFPSPGKIDEAEFEKAVDVKDRTIIYQSITDADTKVKTADRPKLKTAMTEAADLMTKVQSDSKGLKDVFGGEDANAKSNYEKGRLALLDVAKDMGSRLSTDYNLDDPEMFLGGWADFDAKHIHLLAEVVRVKDLSKAKVTIIHEAVHLADKLIDDHGYYNTKNFESLDEKVKVNNAAHYEELPRRELGTSKFKTTVFTPNVSASGKAVTREDRVQRDASEYLRQAWDAAVDTHTFIRSVRLATLSGNGKPLKDNSALIMEISKKMDLTIHEQASSVAIVTALDITITESIARAVHLIKQKSKSVPFPSPIGALTDTELRDKIVAEAVKQYGELLKDATRDKALLDWLVAHYRSLPSV